MECCIIYICIGMKAYKNINDSSDVRLFRPDLNMKRLKDSMERLSMSGNDFDPQELIDLIGTLVRLGECIRECSLCTFILLYLDVCIMMVYKMQEVCFNEVIQLINTLHLQL